MEVNQTHRKFLRRQETLVTTKEKGESSQENGQFAPHSAQPREPTPRGENHVQSPSANRRSSKARKLPQVGRKRGHHVVGTIFPCKICLRPFTNRTSAALHAHTHLNPHELEQSSLFHEKCPHCEKVFFTRHHFTDHVNAHEGRKNYACSVCKQKFSAKKSLTRHLFVHLSREERAEVRQGWRHVCYFCSKPFQRPSHLSRHVVGHTKEKVGGRCHTCRKSFSSKDSLTKHRFAHLSEDEKVALVKQGSSRVCLFCQMKFPDNRTYHVHLVSHTEEKPFRCDQCGALFGHQSVLTMHARIHSADPRPFKCTECDQVFTQKSSLTSHKKTVHRKRKDIACPECGKKFGRKGDMVRHLRSVHAKNRHSCPHCGETFSRKDHLGRHLKKVHPPE
ncbi:zinc finger protein OZF-like [Folsomia candida]|uniref:zinc finger protein OZF-like n=1 Tax=Folsomia candida TaxID=158441 RepID=UPI001604D5AB|nr:zinc finger protein OZF-like [Folsomia candida]